MKNVPLETENTKTKRSLKIDVSNPSTVEEAVKVFTPEIVLSLFLDALNVRRQARVRGMLGKEGDDRMTDAKIVEEMKGWKPKLRGEVDPAKRLEKAEKALEGLDASAVAAILKKFGGPALVKAPKQAAGNKPKAA